MNGGIFDLSNCSCQECGITKVSEFLPLVLGPHASGWGPPKKTLVDPHSQPEQLQKLKMPTFISIKADEKIRYRLSKLDSSPLTMITYIVSVKVTQRN